MGYIRDVDQYRQCDGAVRDPGGPKAREGDREVLEGLRSKLKKGKCRECRHWVGMGVQSYCSMPPKMSAGPDDTCGRWEIRWTK